MVFASGLSAAPVWQSSSRTLSINSQRPQCPTKHAATPPAAQERPVCTSTVPIRPCVIKCMCSLATCPSLYSFNFAYTSLYISPSLLLSPWFVRWSDCFSLPPPQWYLAILICIYMPLLCGRRAAEIDQQHSGMFYYMSVGGRNQTQWAHTSAHTCA